MVHPCFGRRTDVGATTAFLDWSNVVEAYIDRWIPCNRGFFEAVVLALPDMPDYGPLLVPGAGPGCELPLLLERFPGRRIVASDPSAEMVQAINRQVETSGTAEIVTEVKPLEELEPSFGAAAVSFFTVHTLRNPVEAILSQARAVRHGGWSAVVYFPPIPEPGGPLDALYRAARVVRPKDPPDWELRLCDAVREAGMVPLTMETLRQTWRFDTPDDFRELMELLPHIRKIREKVGEESYEAMWKAWSNEPGLVEDEDDWVGEAAARFVLIAC
ncbi:methyltransferase domain-containing protein [bacterium]|nr:methyltransferase domain-containing protein [bacterium]